MNNETIIYHILKFLFTKELVSCSNINKKFHNVCNSWMLWKYNLANDLEITEITEDNTNIHCPNIYKYVYMKHIELYHNYASHLFLVKKYSNKNDI